MKTRKKLIEVALPLEAINTASAREKSIRHGHPSTLHLWWARRPLAAARAVIFAQMVDDPAEYLDVLLSDPEKRRKAEKVYRARKKAWDERKAELDRARAAGMDKLPDLGPEPQFTDVLAEQERDRLFKIIEDLVQWENTTNETVLQRARDEIWQSWRRACADNADHPRARELFDRNKLPAFHDPFAGGGSIPLEAQRLGLEAYASDLNPVAVLINKAMIEIPPKFAGCPPVNPDARKDQALIAREWKGAQGLAEDVRYYGKWMRDEAEKRIGHLYPKVEITAAMAAERPDLKPYVGRKLTVIAWLWARTVKSPNPAFSHVDVPLASTFMLSTKPGKEAYVEPVIEGDSYRFTVKVGQPQDPEAAKNGTKLARGAHFMCFMSGMPIPSSHIYGEAMAGRMGSDLMAVVAEGDRSRIHLPPTAEMVDIARSIQPSWKPELDMPDNPRWFSPPQYGLKTYGDLFTSRQLVALTTFADLVGEALAQVRLDAVAAGMKDDGKVLAEGGLGATAYAEAVGVYLAFAVDRGAESWCSLSRWQSTGDFVAGAFSRQALAMLWDYAEVNPFSNSTRNFADAIGWVVEAIETLPNGPVGRVSQHNAGAPPPVHILCKLVSTDPPYYDNIGYADLSDFFYVWLRCSARSIFPDLFATVAVPKSEELVASPYRHGSKAKAEAFFLTGMSQVMDNLLHETHVGFPITIYYAFKQSESETDLGTTSTGWETFLDALIQAGFTLSGTWPMRTERGVRVNNLDTNALASSIVLVCRPRAADAPTATRRAFVAALKSELPTALAHLQRGNIAPVDLAQAAIGPGMAVFTRYAKVLDASGKPMTVREALALINQTLDEALAEQEGDFDADSRWALAWFEQNGFNPGEFGVAETLSKAKNTSVGGMVEAGIVSASHGKVRLLRPGELPGDWDPAKDKRLTAWEAVHHLVRVLEAGGEGAAAQLAASLGAQAETARELAYRLYTVCERKKRAPEALSYNGLVQSWPEIVRLAREGEAARPAQGALFSLDGEA